MTREETIKIMAVLKGAYPMYYRDMKRTEAESVVALWQEMFADDEYPFVAAAVKALIATDTKGFPPHIGAVKAKLRQITTPEEMSEAEAWSLVQRALSNGLYGSEKEFARLPENIQRLVGSPNQLREWAMMPVDEVASVVASNFQRSYRARTSAQRDFDALPSDVQALAAHLGDRLSLGTPKDEMKQLLYGK